MDLLLDVWREACRHVEMGEFVARIAPRLAAVIPFDLLLVRRMELEHLRIDTCAGSGREGCELPDRTRTECAAERMDELLQWCRGKEILRGTVGGGERLLDTLVPI